MIARVRAEARRHWGNLYPFGQGCAVLTVSVLLAAAGLVGMVDRGGAPAPASIEGAAPGAPRGLTDGVTFPPSTSSSSPSMSPILPPADLAMFLRAADRQEAGSVSESRVAEGDRGLRSSGSAIPLTRAVPGEGAASGAGEWTPGAPRYEPGLWGDQLSPAEVYGLAVEVTGDHGWASFASRCFTGGGENRGFVGAVSHVNKNGTQDLGLGQSNTNTLAGLGFDADRVLVDAHYAMEALHATYEAQGFGAWLGCVAHGDAVEVAHGDAVEAAAGAGGGGQ
ncbi:MAG: hypothetical protein CVU47_12480 [Chloroflexi bacterium HGW-Chloroflexi-9]|nr:MAG: hypothetical protein CVU47_12480 [Chloroflexi bacterium HGW-Chloroflexi-9]